MSGKISSNVQHLCDTQVRKPVDAHKKSTKGVYFVPHAYLENTTACHVWNTSKFFLADCIWTQLANLLLSSFFFFLIRVVFYSFLSLSFFPLLWQNVSKSLDCPRRCHWRHGVWKSQVNNSFSTKISGTCSLRVSLYKQS